MFKHQDTLNELNKNVPLGEKMGSIHRVIKAQYTFIERIAVAIYDPKTDILKTYVNSTDESSPLNHYQAPMSEAPSLQEIVKLKKPRVVNDLVIFSEETLSHEIKEHTQKLREKGYVSSYTMPMYLNDIFFGFVFFNSSTRDAFSEDALHYFDLIGHLISLLIINEQTSIRTLLATVKMAHDITHHRDTETGAHIDRMSRYSRLIAVQIADKYELNDEYIENVFLFSPLHDLGKIAIADNILQKPGKLNAGEFEIMQTHARKGREIIDSMLQGHGLDSFQSIDILRNIAEYHHEAVNGSGYPKGLQGDAIPLEARIVAVADIFDALTSRRPYKEPWSNDDAYAMLQRLAGEKLDKDCVNALLDNREQVEEIQQKFTEDEIG